MIPQLDFSAFTNGTAIQREQFCSELVAGLSQLGFIKLINHGLSKDEIVEVFSWVRNLLPFVCLQLLMVHRIRSSSIFPERSRLKLLTRFAQIPIVGGAMSAKKSFRVLATTKRGRPLTKRSETSKYVYIIHIKLLDLAN